MDIGDWITLSAVIVALGIGVASILHTESLRKRERKEKLLNEVIDWAVDVYVCGIESHSERLINFASKYLNNLIRLKEDFYRELRLIECSDLSDLIISFSVIKKRGLYIINISPRFGGNSNLHTYVTQLVSDIEYHLNLIEKYFKEMSHDIENIKWDTSDYVDNIHNHKQKLDLSVEKVIDEATKIKTENII